MNYNHTENNSVEKWTRQECEDYLENYPDSFRAEAVRKRYEVFKPEIEAEKQDEIAQQKKDDDAFWAANNSSLKELERYIKKYPKGLHLKEYENKKKELIKAKEAREWEANKRKNTFKKVVKTCGYIVVVLLAVGIVITYRKNNKPLTFSMFAPLAGLYYWVNSIETY